MTVATVGGLVATFGTDLAPPDELPVVRAEPIVGVKRVVLSVKTPDHVAFSQGATVTAYLAVVDGASTDPIPDFLGTEPTTLLMTNEPESLPQYLPEYASDICANASAAGFRIDNLNGEGCVSLQVDEQQIDFAPLVLHEWKWVLKADDTAVGSQAFVTRFAFLDDAERTTHTIFDERIIVVDKGFLDRYPGLASALIGIGGVVAALLVTLIGSFIRHRLPESVRGGVSGRP